MAYVHVEPKGDFMSKAIYDGRIDGEFGGFDDEALYKMGNGTYWIQAQHLHWYHYAYCPEAVISEERGNHILTVAGQTVLVRRVTDIVESRIAGEFKGWDGKISYGLENGQVWQQRTYKYQYKYAYMPVAIVYKADTGFRMSVAGTNADVDRIR